MLRHAKDLLGGGVLGERAAGKSGNVQLIVGRIGTLQARRFAGARAGQDAGGVTLGALGVLVVVVVVVDVVVLFLVGAGSGVRLSVARLKVFSFSWKASAGSDFFRRFPCWRSVGASVLGRLALRNAPWVRPRWNAPLRIHRPLFPPRSTIVRCACQGPEP